jgi:O-antigen/teichoic acid export membrane protein
VLGGPEYLPDGAIALQLMIWSIPIGWINSVTNYTLIALDQQRVLTWTFVGGVGFNVIANLLLLPQYGYRAAALLHILSEAVLLALFLVVMWRGLRGRVREEERRSAVNLGTLLGKPGAATAAMFGILAALWNVNGLLALAGAGSAYLLALLVLHPFDTTERARLAPLLPGRLRLRLGITPSPAEAGSSGRGRTP